MKIAKRTMCLLAGSALALAAAVPMTASAHTRVFLGINLGGWSAPPVEVYTPPVYYAPPRIYYARPVYYPPRVVYTEPYGVYYRGWDHDGDRHWRRGWRNGWYHHGDYDWHHHRWDHDDGDDNDQ